MLRTRLWMGAILIAVAAAVLIWDRFPFPFFSLLVTGLACGSALELFRLLPSNSRPALWLCLTGVTSLMMASFFTPLFYKWQSTTSWTLIVCAFAGVAILAFLVEMATFREPGQSVTRISLTVWLVAYLGLLPCFLFQLRFLMPQELGTAALLLTIFVPKCCDIGAYCTGRLIGRYRMTPVLSPKKTWEGAIGGLATAVLTAVLLDHIGPAPLLQQSIVLEVGFGLSVGLAGILGDLAESLIKRDMQQKDASQLVPGFGGVLDVVDAILFAAPVSYLWLAMP